MTWENQRLSTEARLYLTRITADEPRQAYCKACSFLGDCVLLSTQWKQIDETKYSFKQVVQCMKCLQKTQYVWERDFSITWGHVYVR